VRVVGRNPGFLEGEIWSPEEDLGGLYREGDIFKPWWDAGDI